MLKKIRLYENPNIVYNVDDKDDYVVDYTQYNQWFNRINYTFAYYNNNFYIKKNEKIITNFLGDNREDLTTHAKLYQLYLDDNNLDDNNKYIEGRGDYAGRIYLEDKLISFWFYPENMSKFRQICRDIKNEADVDIFGESGWKIEINKSIKTKSDNDFKFVGDWNLDYSDSIYIPVEDFVKSGKWDKDEIEAPHLMDPEAKKKMLMNQGYRAKETKWKKHMKPFESYQMKEPVSGVFSVKIEDTIMYFKLKYSDEIYLELDGELYQNLSITLPTTDILEENEFFINPDVDHKIIEVLVRENFIEKSNNVSVAGDKKTNSYIIL